MKHQSPKIRSRQLSVASLCSAIPFGKGLVADYSLCCVLCPDIPLATWRKHFSVRLGDDEVFAKAGDSWWGAERTPFILFIVSS